LRCFIIINFKCYHPTIHQSSSLYYRSGSPKPLYSPKSCPFLFSFPTLCHRSTRGTISSPIFEYFEVLVNHISVEGRIEPFESGIRSSSLCSLYYNLNFWPWIRHKSVWLGCCKNLNNRRLTRLVLGFNSHSSCSNFGFYFESIAIIDLIKDSGIVLSFYRLTPFSTPKILAMPWFSGCCLHRKISLLLYRNNWAPSEDKDFPVLR